MRGVLTCYVSLDAWLQVSWLDCSCAVLFLRLKIAVWQREFGSVLKVLDLSFIVCFSIVHPPGHFFSHQPSFWYLPGGSCGKGAAEWDHPLRWALHQNLRHQQGSDVVYIQHIYMPALWLTVCPLPCFHRRPRRSSKVLNRPAIAWASTGCLSPGLPSKTANVWRTDVVCAVCWILMLSDLIQAGV